MFDETYLDCPSFTVNGRNSNFIILIWCIINGLVYGRCQAIGRTLRVHFSSRHTVDFKRSGFATAFSAMAKPVFIQNVAVISSIFFITALA